MGPRHHFHVSVLQRRRVVAPLVVLALVVAAAVTSLWLASRRDDDRPAGHIRQWVAVLSVGPDARSLYASAADVGKVAGVYVFVDRWACYEGFPSGARPSSDEWFLGVAANERDVVDGIVAQLGRTPIVEAEVEQGCALPVDRSPPASVS
jgi:hypothetical protein